jgi:hypothetical protein
MYSNVAGGITSCYTASRFTAAGARPGILTLGKPGLTAMLATNPSMPDTPDGYPADAMARLAGQRRRRHAAIRAIREHLTEQPTERSVRAAGRDWLRDITCLVDDVAADVRRRTEVGAA